MSKVICDVCGTSFPETAAQCPICGSAKVSSAQTEQQSTGYTYVKGGRFSKSNVRKRNSAKTAAPQRRASSDRPSPRRTGGSDENANRALIAVVILLLLAIVAVVIYIGVRFIGPADKPDDSGKTGQSQNDPNPNPNNPGPSSIPCTSLQATLRVEITSAGQNAQINVEKAPKETTDVVTFESADTAIATVSADGIVTPVANGQTTVTVKCGSQTITCTVIVSIGGSQPDNPDNPENPVVPGFVLAFRKDDVSLERYGQTWKAYDGAINAELITWTSDDPAVCTIENGVVTAVGPGQTKIYGQYGDQLVTCIIRCKDTVVPPDTDPNVIINKEDVSISIDEKFTLTLKKNVEGQEEPVLLEVTWTASEDGIVSIEGNTIKGVAAGQVTVSAVYEGKTYKCIVRVKAAE